jgi:cytochrome c oxidase subunit 3
LRLTTAQLAVLVGLVSLTFFFGGLILAFGLRIEQATTWERFAVPNTLWPGTMLLLLSSWTLEAGRHSVRRGLVASYRRRISLTIALALIFLCIQTVSATDLMAQGVAVSGNPHGSAFYAFMGIHGAHLLGGITWMFLLLSRSKRLFAGTETDLRTHRRAIGAAAVYWHFMGALWLILFLILRRWTAA